MSAQPSSSQSMLLRIQRWPPLQERDAVPATLLVKRSFWDSPSIIRHRLFQGLPIDGQVIGRLATPNHQSSLPEVLLKRRIATPQGKV